MTPQTEQQQQEMERIAKLADGLGLCGNPYMLPCILLRLGSEYAYRDKNDRKTVEELLTSEFKARAQQLHRIVGSSDMSPLLQQVICESVESYLRRNGVGDVEMAEFKATSDYDGTDPKFDIFAGLD